VVDDDHAARGCSCRRQPWLQKNKNVAQILYFTCNHDLSSTCLRDSAKNLRDLSRFLLPLPKRVMFSGLSVCCLLVR